MVSEDPRRTIPDSWRALPWVDDVRVAGGRVFVVGGTARDWLKSSPPADLDVLVSGLDAQNLSKILERHGRVDLVGAAFSVFKWRSDDGDLRADVVLPRTERSTGPGHRDFEIHSDASIAVEDDLARRDFTVNAIAVLLPDGEIVDPHGGARDLEAGILRAVGDPDERFQEDPLRILRAAGFAGRFGLQVEDRTLASMAESASRVITVAPERIATELVKLLGRSPRPSVGLRLLDETGVMEHLVPEWVPCRGFDQKNPYHHLLLDEHVYETLDETARRTEDVVIRTAAWLHDLGKPDAYTEETKEDGAVVGHFYGHEKVSARMARDVLTRYQFSAAEGFPRGGVDAVCHLIRHHLVQLDGTSSDRAVRRWIARLKGPANARRLLLLWAGDRAAHRDGLDEERLADLVRRIEEVGSVPLSDHDLAIDGSVLAEALNISGMEIGQMKSDLLARVIDGEVVNEEGALLAAARESMD